LRLLVVLLGTATFFEGYDSGINAVVLKDVAKAFHVSLEQTGRLTAPIAIIGMGAFGALAVTTLGDRFGRRPLLISTTLFYALFTGLTATASSLATFVLYQFAARTFLIAEYATAITIVAEEYPAARRGRAMGTLAAVGAFGLPVVAVLHLIFVKTGLGWRGLYLVGLLPLLVVALLRLKLRETSRWVQAQSEGASPGFRHVIREANRRVLVTVCLLYFFVHFALLGAATWWPYYAGVQRHFSDATITWILATAYPLGMVGSFAAGRLQDRYGRRPVGLVFLLMTLVSTVIVFQISTPKPMFFSLAAAVFFGIGVTPILNALASELFHTEIRATAVALARSVFGTLGAIAGPFAIGLLADRGLAARFSGGPFLGDLGASVSLGALMYLPAAFLLMRLPETAGLELEAIDPSPAPAHQ